MESMTWLRRIDPNEFGENPTKPNFLFNFPSSASSGRKFRNFQRAIHTNLSNVLIAKRRERTRNIAGGKNTRKPFMFSFSTVALTRHI